MSDHISDVLALFGSDVGTPFQQILHTFREVDGTFSALQRTAELFLWGGDDVPNDKAAWLAAYFDRLANSGSEYRGLALQEIRAAGREARASLDVPALQATFRDYDSARDRFHGLAESTETLTRMYTWEFLAHGHQMTVQQAVDDLRAAVAAINVKIAPGRETLKRALPALELLVGSEAILEDAIQGLANYSPHTGPSATILAVWEDFNRLEEVRTGAYNAARGLLDKAYIVWDLESTTDQDRREVLEMMQASHKMLCDQIVPTARLSQRIKEAQLSMTFNPDRVVGADGRVWSVDNLRLAMPGYRLVQKCVQTYTEAVQIEICNVVNLPWRPE